LPWAIDEGGLAEPVAPGFVEEGAWLLPALGLVSGRTLDAPVVFCAIEVGGLAAPVAGRILGLLPCATPVLGLVVIGVAEGSIGVIVTVETGFLGA
jgi:hypothetical protein